METRFTPESAIMRATSFVTSVPLVNNARCLTPRYSASAAGVTLLGEVGGHPFYIGAAQFEYWRHTHLIIDVNGYFAPAGVGGLSFYNATPCRAWAGGRSCAPAAALR